MSNKNSKSKKNTKISSKQVNKKVTKNKSTSRIGFLLFTFVFMLVILVATVFSDVQQVIANKKETESLSNRYIELLEEEASLNSQVIKLQDPEYKARYARENQMYTKDGETILIIIDKDGKRMITTEEE
ncbi:MAG: septum formation initiator family protein [Bacilli bacterium]|nr:septum formation initiator family protein [Bacilli bacterium]